MFGKKQDGKAAILQALQDDAALVALLGKTLGADFEAWYNTRRTNEPKRLVNPAGDFVSEFQAAGKTYYIQDPKKGLPVARAMELEKMSVVIGYDASFENIAAWFIRVKKKINSFFGNQNPDVVGLMEEVVNMEKGLRSGGEYPPALVMCTLFIYRPGEDLRTWSYEDAKEKIKDWLAEGLIFDDFFTLATVWSTRKYTLFGELLEKIKRGLRVFGFLDI